MQGSPALVFLRAAPEVRGRGVLTGLDNAATNGAGAGEVFVQLVAIAHALSQAKRQAVSNA